MRSEGPPPTTSTGGKRPPRLPTLKDVATAAGIHTGTASRALNPESRHLVNPDTARRVQEAAHALGYRINPIARSLKTARSMTIGVVVPDITNPIFPPLARGVESVATEAGYTSLLINTDGDLRSERSRIESLRARQVDGLVIATARRQHPMIEELCESGLPLVLVNRKVDGLDIASVVPDDAAGVTMVVRHLAALGHRRIAYLGGPNDTSTGVDRSRAFHAALLDLGIHDDLNLASTAEGWTFEAGRRAADDMFRRHLGGFTAFVGGNDLIALGAIELLASYGLRCPEDVSVVGFNDGPMLDQLKTPLTTVAAPHQEIGEVGCRLLLERIRDPESPTQSITVPVSLVIRGSTGPVARNVSA